MSALALVSDNSATVETSVASLPALVRRAADSLASAITSAEVLDAKAMATFAYDAAKAAARYAKAQGAFDEVVSAVYRAQADALLIESNAKRRLADEYDAAQRTGVAAQRGMENHRRGNIVKENVSATLADIGLTAEIVHCARKDRDIELQCPGIIQSSIEAVLDRGKEPTKAAVGREISTRLNSYSGDNEWYTPAKYVEMAREVLGAIDVDPASNATAQKTVHAATHYTVDNSGLDKEWRGRVWMNPPYSQPEINQFAEKLLEELSAERTTAAIVLTNNSGDTAWHHALAEASSAMCITRGRIKFESPTRASNSPAMGQSFFYFGPDPGRFAEGFKDIGRISKGWSDAPEAIAA